MSDFDIKVRVDPGNASSAIGQIEGDLSGLEAQATKAKISVGKIASGFKDIAAAAAPGVGAVLAVGKAIDTYVTSMREMHDRVVKLTNAGEKFAEQFGTSTAAIEAQRGAASRLHATLGETLSVYDAVGDATENLKLTTVEQLKLTENLGMAAKISGNSLESVSTTLNTLAVAFETGGNAGAALTKLFRQQHDLGNDLAASLHMSKAAIIDAVKTGTLSYDQLIRALANGGTQTHETFGRMQQTYEQWSAQAKESYEIARVGGDGFFGSLKAGIDQANGDLEKSKLTFQQWSFDVLQSLDKIRAKLDNGPDALGFGDIARFNKTAEDMRQFDADLEQFNQSVYTWNRGVQTAFDDETDAIRAMRKELVEFNRELNAGNAARNLAGINLGDGSVTGGMMQTSQISLGANAFTNEGNGQDARLSGLEISIPEGDKVRQELDDLGNKAAEAAEHARLAWASAAGDMTGNLLKMATDGKRSFGDMTDAILRDIARIAIQQAVLQMGGGSGAFVASLGASLLGGAHGFDYTANSNATQLPGFSHGGSMTVTGGGGTDDHLAMFRVSSGESIHVRTPQQQLMESMAVRGQQPAASGGSGRTTINMITSSDPREVTAAMGTFEGDRYFLRSQRKFSRRRVG